MEEAGGLVLLEEVRVQRFSDVGRGKRFSAIGRSLRLSAVTEARGSVLLG